MGKSHVMPTVWKTIHFFVNKQNKNCGFLLRMTDGK